MRKLFVSIVGIAAALAVVAPAHAAIIYDGVLAGLGTGTTFDAATTTTLNSPGYTENNLTFLGNGGATAQILNNSTGNGAEPFGDTGNYLSVLGGGSVKVTIGGGGANQLTFYWGSIDTYNKITFFDALNNPLGTFTGSSITPKIPSGCQNSDACAGLVKFTDDSGLFTSFVLSSTQNSFETDNFNAIQAAVPEASTWLMMIVGFLGVGLVSYRRKGAGLALRWV
jgi:hypothetical protein